MTHSDIELSIAQERLRQARYSFNLALIATAASFSLGLAAAGVLLTGKLAEGSVMAVGGLASSVRCIQFAKDVSDKLDKLTDSSDDAEKTDPNVP
jgi:hypothetical protein